MILSFSKVTVGPRNTVEITVEEYCTVGPSRKKIAMSQEGFPDDNYDYDGFRLIHFQILKSFVAEACVRSKC